MALGSCQLETGEPLSGCFVLGKLHTLDADTAATTWEDHPLPWFQTGVDQGAMHGRGGAHDRAGDLIRHAVGDSRGVDGGRGEVLLVCAGRLKTGVDALRAVVLSYAALISSYSYPL